MTYLGITRLASDGRFIERTDAAFTEQAMYYKDAAAADFKALAEGLLRGEPSSLRRVFTHILATAPGFAAAAETPSGGVDASQIPDVDILAAVQADWATVAGLYFMPDGTPRV